MTRKHVGPALVVLVALGLLACTEPDKPKAPEKPPERAAETKSTDTPASQPTGKTALRRSSEQCVGVFADTPVKTLKIAGKDWELRGSTLTQKATDADETMVVGLVADLKEDSPENLANIDKYLQFFKAEKVELIIVDGDTGESKQQVANNLKRIASIGLPVGIIIGNRECRTDFNLAVEEVQQRAPNVFNLNFVRHIIGDDAEFVTMPGYYNAAYLHCVEGCQYFEEDVTALGPIIDAAKKPVVLVSHGPPRQTGQNAIDRISEGTNEGDPALTELIKAKHIMFGLFANIHEAGGKATDLKGDSIVKEGAMVDSLYLNSGPGDSVRWTMNNGSESIGMAAVVHFKGKTASYKMFRMSAAQANVRKK